MSGPRYQQNKEIAWRRVTGDGVLIAPLTADVTVLNETGTRLWELWEAPLSAEAAARILAQEYRVELATACAEAAALAATLVDRGLLLELP